MQNMALMASRIMWKGFIYSHKHSRLGKVKQTYIHTNIHIVSTELVTYVLVHVWTYIHSLPDKV